MQTEENLQLYKHKPHKMFKNTRPKFKPRSKHNTVELS